MTTLNQLLLLVGSSLADIIETEYKCCLPTDCSDPNTNIMTINVFGELITSFL